MKKLFLLLALFALVSCDQQSATTSLPSTPKDPLPDFSEISDVKAKKEAFFSFLLPFVYHSNQEILDERNLVKQWLNNSQKLSSTEQKRLAQIMKKYRVTSEDPSIQKQQLLKRVNTIAPSLVLAQAANESAWGSSRFAKQGNNLFGQWCYTKGCGLVPGKRNDDAKHEVQIFKTPYESVASYMRNLNSHPQYQDLRNIRNQLLANNETVSGMQLAQGLIGYSERREAYVEEIQAMIRHNKLAQLDSTPTGPETQDVE